MITIACTARRPACASRASTSAGTVETLPGGPAFRAKMNLLETCAEQVAAVADWFDELSDRCRLLPDATAAAGAEPMLQ